MSGFSAAWAIETLIASTLLMGFVLLVRRHAQRAFGTQLAYWLWALPALRMALPPLPAAWREQAALPISDARETVMVYLSPLTDGAGDVTAAAAPAFPWLLLLGAGWTLGATLFFVWHGAAHFAYVRRILAPPATRATLADGTTLIESDEAVGPVAFGVLRRFVAVPTDFAERWDADERRLALAHELGHHARGDLVANWLGLAVLALHWWNPLAWAAYKKFRADQEMANDARVLAGLPPIERHAYACAIVKAAHGRAVTAACHLHTIEDLKGRLRMLKNNRKSRRVLAAGAMGIGALTMAGLGLTASSAAAEKIRTVAAVQAPLLAAQAAAAVAPVPPAPIAPPAPPAPPAVRKIVIVRDGKTVTYEGARAEKWLTENSDVPANVRVEIEPGVAEANAGRAEGLAAAREARAEAAVARAEAQVAARQARAEGQAAGREARREATAARAEAYAAAKEARASAFAGRAGRSTRLITIRDRNGKITRYEGPAADAYWRAHPGMVPPVPPGSSGPGIAAPPLPPAPPAMFWSGNGRTIVKRADGKSFAITVPQVVSRDSCADGDNRTFVLTQKQGKRPVTIICRDRIAGFSANMEKAGTRANMSMALAGLETGRRAIEANRNLTDAQRAEALKGIASARVELERELAAQ